VEPAFIPGLQLAREFYATVVRPLVEEQLPPMRYTAALLGPGSEVAGFDTQRSTDHDWGPRLQVFLSDGDADRHAAAITTMLASRLPPSFRGHPIAFPVTRDPGSTARHRVEVAGLGAWLTGQLGFDPRRGVILLDWLATPAQRLAEITGGMVFHDGLGELTRARAGLAWYPRDVWLYLLACQWQRIGQEEAFPGRCAEAGDDLGSVIVTARPALLPALQQMAGYRLRAAPRHLRAHSIPGRRDIRWQLAHPRAAPVPRLRGCRRPAQPAGIHPAAEHPDTRLP
jgi:hypothetical protein